jgi:hypothetical protein
VTTKRQPNDDARVVIHDRKFWRVFPDGKWQRIYLSERAKGHLWQTKATAVRGTGNAG